MEDFVRHAVKFNRGLFLVFEGMDCSGKSTGVKWAVDKLNELKIPVINLRQPGGTELGEKIRDIVLNGNDINAVSELLLMEASRVEAYHAVINPALSQGTWVVCDRFNASSYAYQGAGKGLSRKTIYDAVERNTPSRNIDCNVYIHRPFEDILAYLDTKEKDRMESLNKSVLEDIYDEYEKLFKMPGQKNWYKISNDTDIDTYKEEVENLITELAITYQSEATRQLCL